MITSGNGKAIYLVIADKIIDEILAGRLGPGDRLLSIRDYAAEVQVNHNTVKRAYDYLSDHQLIFNRRGIGFYVSEDARATGEKMRRRELLGNELDNLFRKLRLLDVTPEELGEKYREFLRNLDINNL